jgi:hypothetical protein
MRRVYAALARKQACVDHLEVVASCALARKL